MRSPLVSIVLPFHNTVDHLRESIASALAQSHDNFELILQDNASNDGSTEIALEFARADRRISFFRHEHLLDQIPNYNLALTRIAPASDYTKMVQADDWITPDCLRLMVELAERSPRVGLVSSYRFRGGMIAGEGLPYQQTILSGSDAVRLHLLTSSFLLGSPTTVMYRSAAVRRRSPFFPEKRLNPDTETCYELFHDWDFGFVHQVLSFSRVSDDSIYGRIRRNDGGILGALILLDRYGAAFLSADELAARMSEIRVRYYRRLARAVLAGRHGEYWRFQRHWLATQGLRILPTGLAGGLLRELAATLVCPQRILDIIAARKAS